MNIQTVLRQWSASTLDKAHREAGEIAASRIDALEAALEECHQAFRDRKHGGVAEQKLRHDIEQILGMPYEG